MTASLDWARLFKLEGPRLRRFLRRFEPAISPEDVAQDSFARLWAAEPQRIASPADYLFRTAINIATDHARRRKASPVVSARNVEHIVTDAVAPSPEDLRIAAETAQAVREALLVLSERERMALIRCKVEGCPLQDIAEELGLSVRQVQRLIAQALAKCQAYLREHEDKTGPLR
ncbi:MAG: RpoE-family sigma factor [Alphaproteobacteria bacterium]|nr:MAG: RpoE-family sigma factor [Alphaproteobacteria bacterium]